MWKWLLLVIALASIPIRAEQLVVITGGSGAAHAWVDSPSPFWVRVQNNGTAPVGNLMIQLVGDEFGPLCWKTAGPASGCSPAPTDLGAGAVLFLRGAMTPHVAGDWRPQLILSWGTPTASSVTAVPLGSLKVESYSWSWVQAITESLKNLALPLVVAGIGIYYQNRLKRRETEHDAAEKTRTERAETLRIMLPKSHDYATKYYSALEMRSRNLGKAILNYSRQRTDDALDELTFWVVSLYHANRLLIAEVGAYYFKDRMGEELAIGAFGALNDSLFDGHDSASFALTDLLDLLGARMLIPQGTFYKLMRGASQGDKDQLAGLRWRIQEWMASGSWNDGLEGILVYSRVLGFEMNRPYENWYETKESLDLDEQQRKVVERLLASMRPEISEGIHAYVETYRRKPT